MTKDLMYEEIDEMEAMDFETNMERKEHHRKSRKSKRIEKRKTERQKKSINYALGANRTKYCKQAVHRKNRKNKDELIYNNRKGDYAFKTMLYNIT